MIRRQIILLLASVNVIWCIPLSQFYPYGPDAAEAVAKIAKGNGAFSSIIFTKFPFYFYGQRRESVIVSVNGALTFCKTAPEFTSNSFPLGDNREMVAPFWADTDTSRKGNVWYHETSDPISLKRSNKEIQEVYPEANYTAKSLFIATWEHVGYYNSSTTKTNTFQCILSTNEIQSYVIFLYADGEIQWTTGDADGGVNGLGGIPAQIGVNKGDGIDFETITKSRTHDIIKIASASHMGVPGVLIFKISDANISIKNLNFTSNDDDDEMTTTFNTESEYYLSFINNHRGGEAKILIMSTDSEPVSYSIQAPGIGFHHNGTVTTDHEAIINLPSTAEVTSHTDQNKAIYLKASSNSIIVIGQNVFQSSSDTFLVQPIITLSSTMYVYYGISSRRTTAHGGHSHSSILLVGIENDTTMKLKVTQSVTISVGCTTINLISGKYYSFMINRLQTIYIESLEDLTGTKVIADKQLSVFSGHECANVPYDIVYCDYLVEQIPPTTTWGKVCYAVPLASRRSYTIKILAAYDSTNITFSCNNSMESHVISEGDIFVKTLQLQEYCMISSKEEILVVQFSHGTADDNSGDPMMTLVPVTNQYSYKFKFSTLRNVSQSYKHYVNIIVMAQYYQPNMIYLIAGGVRKSLNTQQWVPIKANNIIEAYATQVNIPEGVVEIIHSNTAALMTTIVYGFTRITGYGHPGGLFSDFKSISGPPPNFVISPSNQTIELSTNNHNISLTCMANNTISYIWDRQNGGIPSGAIGKYNNILILINVQPKDSGNYRCVATNNYGTTMSDYATIIIKEKPCKITSVTGKVIVDKNNVTIVFSADNSLASFKCRLDNKKRSSCSSPTTWTDVKSGQHSITLVAKCPENEGKVQIAKKRYKFQIA